MSIFASLYVAVSGMRSNQTAISVIGNNIANQNTIGFKASRAVFGDLVAQPIAGSAGVYQRGGGSGVETIQKLMTSGALLGTNNSTDLAIFNSGLLSVVHVILQTLTATHPAKCPCSLNSKHMKSHVQRRFC